VFLCNYEHTDGTTFRGRSGAVKIPSELEGIVEGVFGLDSRPQAHPRFMPLRTVHGLHVSPKSQTTSFNPNDLAPLYDFPAGDGSNQCVAIIELGGGYRAADLTSYFNSLGIATEVNVTSIAIDGAANNPSTPDGADGEVMLDIEVIGALAPACKIVVYFAPNTDAGFLDAITAAVHDNENKPSVVSISWGAAESQWTQQSLDAFNSVFKDAALLGVTVCAAAGDNGAADNVSDGQAHVDFPASSPYVLACGGTTLAVDQGVIKSEVVWNDGNGGATGGGVSGYFVVPDYQTQNGVNPVTVNPNLSGFKGRGLPDISADADPATGYNVLVDGQSMVIGGTSAVAPLMSALIARINQALGHSAGFLHPILYKAQPSTDIVKGDNNTGLFGLGLGYKAAPGWDACTGIGSPLGTKLLDALNAVAQS
jgi:kumamolisin